MRTPFKSRIMICENFSEPLDSALGTLREEPTRSMFGSLPGSALASVCFESVIRVESLLSIRIHRGLQERFQNRQLSKPGGAVSFSPVAGIEMDACRAS